MNNLSVIENEGLIKVEVNENQEPIVNARELHEFLEVNSNYTTWFKRMCEYGFTINEDFIPILEESTGGRPSENHVIKLDMAKEIAMIQRNEKGKQARKYFLQIEKDWNSPEKVMARALIVANKTIEKKSREIEEKDKVIQLQQPKVLFADSVASSNDSILVGELAKLLKQNGIDTGEKRLFAWLRDNGYLIKRKGEDYNTPTQKSVNLGVIETKEGTRVHPNGYISVTKTPKITGKGQIYFINKFKKNNQISMLG
ncbi:TPA: phage antirepressor KilAC domain-containing protein [Clostridioides difficile]|uniref:phage antirepressor KilAC domain-containing protein n=1 Tax=Clostridioides difficile TaxID=1496 RepID=UPI00093F8E7D|nr:phage antirepressor KilAC domain-containing protein [Clostridioides difficile]MBY1129663.1 phage antirepressor KilAC domain-containing protein [Clostridioides difficile]MBY2546832.1 phage antirepressor KilAC domain-containing protein [Clostridioides difficile]MCO5842004.1 phage antirepressor KilAC domain-containing protein [Clostridioides difficile]MCZ1131240.1 phage antirepressor KilAC domain-containing protein [Clostridioides difficile]MDK3339561.1 phage antirepressor KilAC domain-contain